ncbi:MAG: allantoinase AllB [Candidatus Eisenbacteria bacterium]
MRFRSRRVLLPQGESAACLDVHEGRITSIEPWDAPGEVTHELGEHVLMPGVVDTHVHCNEPGRTEWEGFRTATRAAAAGGVTTLVDMPLNSIPATTTAAAVRAKTDAMAGQLHVDVGLWGGVIPGNAGDLEELLRSGVLGCKCFLSPSGVDEFPHVHEADLMGVVDALSRSQAPLLVHAEDPDKLLAMPVSTRRHSDWLASRPPAAEASAIRMLGRLARHANVRVHIVHVASRAALDAIDEARRAGASMSGETCPHYLTFAAEEIPDGATEYKCAPPIRGHEERSALRRAVIEGRLDLVASDHSPAPPALKRQGTGDFALSWGGIASLELSLPATWTALQEEGASLSCLARSMSEMPARLARLERTKGSLTVGHDADLVVFDPDAKFVVDSMQLHQRHPITPYAGRTLRGRVRGTWLRGHAVYDGSRLLGEPRGHWLRNEWQVLSRPGGVA